MNQVPLKTTYVDRPEVQEVFANHVRMVMVSDGVVHLELCTTHVDDLQPPEVPTGKMYPTVRVAMPVSAAAMLHAHLTQHLTELEKQGMVKREGPQSSGEPKH